MPEEEARLAGTGEVREDQADLEAFEQRRVGGQGVDLGLGQAEPRQPRIDMKHCRRAAAALRIGLPLPDLPQIVQDRQEARLGEIGRLAHEPVEHRDLRARQ